MQANWIIGKQTINGCKYLLLSIKIFPMYNSQNDNSQIALKSNLAVVQLIEKRDIKRRGTFLVGLYHLKGIKTWENNFLILSLLSHFIRVRLCDPIDSSPPGSPVPGILQARTLEWVAISFSNGWKWKVKVKTLNLSHQGSPWILEWVAYLFSRGSSQLRDQSQLSCIAGGFFTSWTTREAI